MKTFIVEFSGMYLPRICGEINEYARKRGLEIVSADVVHNQTGYHVVVVF